MTGTRRECRCPRTRHVHGTDRAYTADACRCNECRAAHAANAARIRRLIAYGRWDRWTDPSASVHRLRALAVVGWSGTQIGRRLNIDPSEVRRIAVGRTGLRIRRDVAARIEAVFEELAMQIPTGDSGAIRRTQARARRLEWLPPLALDDDGMPDTAAPPLLTADALDEMAVVRIMAGTLTARSSPERTEAIRRLARLGLDDQQIADRLGMTRSAVSKHRERHGITAGCARGAKAGPSWRSMRADSRKGAAA